MNTESNDTPLRVGFTGTRIGMSLYQKETLRQMLSANGIVTEFHHGDCIGSDTDSHIICLNMGISIIIHPPTNSRLRNYNNDSKVEHRAKDYLERNKDIVNCTDILIATPETLIEEQRSGTWSTIRYASRNSKIVLLINENGLIYKYFDGQPKIHNSIRVNG